MTAQDYPVTFPYGTTREPYSSQHPHKGADRSMPVGIPVVVAGVTIALSGRSGSFNGIPNSPHCHTQAGTDLATQKTVDPKPFEFKPGTVVALRTIDEKQWGRYITIQNESGMYVTYAHLDKVMVKIGQVIKKETISMPTKEDVNQLFHKWIGRNPSNGELAKYTKSPWRIFTAFLLENQRPPEVKILSPGRYDVK